MSDDIFLGTIFIPSNKPFRWMDEKDDLSLPDDRRNGFYLTDGRDVRHYLEQPRHRIDLMAVPTLHKMFADLDLSNDAIRDFANNWGNLGGMAAKTIEVEENTYVCVERSSWIFQIHQVRQALRGELEGAGSFINLQLRQHTSCGYRPDNDGIFRLRIMPRNLQGAIWLHTVQELSGYLKTRKCEAPNCPEWFIVDPTKRGRKPIYCSKRCTKRAERARNENAESV